MANLAVTVLIDTYNHEHFIDEAIVSAVEQDFPRAETDILVVDDGSTDRTPVIVRKFQARVRLIQKTNGGQASAFSAGIPEAGGRLLHSSMQTIGGRERKLASLWTIWPLGHISEISILECWNRSATRSVRGRHSCSRYIL